MELKNENSLRAVSDNDYILQRNGTDMVCPHIQAGMTKQSIPVADGDKPKEQVVPTRTACSTMCPLLELANDDKGILVAKVCCGSSPISKPINKVITVADQMEASKAGMKAVN